MTISRPIRVVFFGTPAYAVPSLRALAIDPRYDVALVVTQPDRPAGRGNRLQPPPVKRCAEDLRIPIYQPASLREEQARRPLAEAEADLFVVAAFGLIFGRKTLALPRSGSLNLHASLLPAYRGASPIAAAILAGDATTGVSLMVVEQGLDTGSVVDRIAVQIVATDTTESLTSKLAAAAAVLVVPSAVAYVRGDCTPDPQEAAAATIVRQLTKADGWLDWHESANALDRRVRAMWPWPRAWTTFRAEPLQIHTAKPLEMNLSAPPGTLIVDQGELKVACESGSLLLVVVQPAGGRPMPGQVWAAGRRIGVEDRLGVQGSPPPVPPLVSSV